jgi:hypothetical protein
MKILLLILLLNQNGEIEKGFAAPQASREQCEKARAELPPAPEGYRVRSYCVDPKQVVI